MNINLLPWRDEIINYNKNFFWRLMLISVMLGVVTLVFLHYLFFKEITYTKSYTQALEEQKIAFIEKLATYRQQQKINKEIAARFSALQKLQLDRFDTIRILNDLVLIVPKDIYLTFIKRDDNQLELSGTANSNLAIAQLIKAINDSPDMDISSVKRVEKKEGEKLISTNFDLYAVLTLPSLVNQNTKTTGG